MESGREMSRNLNSFDINEFDNWRKGNAVSIAFFEEVDRLLEIERTKMAMGKVIFKDSAEKTLGHSAEASGKCLAFQAVLNMRPYEEPQRQPEPAKDHDVGY